VPRATNEKKKTGSFFWENTVRRPSFAGDGHRKTGREIPSEESVLEQLPELSEKGEVA